MVQLIVGRKGKGKTKCLLDKVNSEVKNILGNVVFLDKNTKHMYELNNKVRMIVVPEFMVETPEEFIFFKQLIPTCIQIHKKFIYIQELKSRFKL